MQALNNAHARLVELARQAVAQGRWDQVDTLALQISAKAPGDASGPFLLGLAAKARQQGDSAARYFEQALAFSPSRFDIGIELAHQWVAEHRYAEAMSMLRDYAPQAGGHAHYLDLAGQAYFAMSQYEDAHQLFAAALQINADAEQTAARFAACAVYLGDIEVARKTYRQLAKQHRRQKYHYELSQLARVQDDRHIKEMLKLLKRSSKAENNIYLYYALGKEYEDLSRFDDAFRFYKKGGDAVATAANYDVAVDTKLIDHIVATCNEDWLSDGPSIQSTTPTPIFVVGLPRTGTTLTDRILSSHSAIQSAGESQLLQMVLRDGERAGNQIGISPELIAAAAELAPEVIAERYLAALSHRLPETPFFIEKLPENILYLGFIAKAWPDARIVHLRRHPMDACFAMYKQSYFRFAYTLEDLASYYLAYDRLTQHWRKLLGDRVVELPYEALVGDQENQIRQLFAKLGIPFEAAALNFDTNKTAVATASSAQVRSKIHTRSVAKWKNFKKQLGPLWKRLEEGGIELDD